MKPVVDLDNGSTNFLAHGLLKGLQMMKVSLLDIREITSVLTSPKGQLVDN